MTISDEQFEQLVGIVNGLVTVVEKGFAEIKLALPPRFPPVFPMQAYDDPDSTRVASVPPLTAAEINVKIDLAERDLESALLLANPKRSQQGIVLYGKLAQLKVELQPDYPEYIEQRDRLLAIVRGTMSGIFYMTVEPKEGTVP